MSLRRQDLPRTVFQSTHPRGVRPALLGEMGEVVDGFNPRTREGCDCFRVLSSRFL